MLVIHNLNLLDLMMKVTTSVIKRNILLASISYALALVGASQAEEGGSAHYMPGATASFIDAFPAKPGGFAVLNYFTYYDAQIDPNRSLLLGGLLASGLDATVYAD